MKPKILTVGIVLARTDFQEADRILTILTPDYGKLRVIAKGVRRQRSKLAGGIELFCISSITVVQGRSELGTLISARLQTHYNDIVKDIRRTMLGYEILRRMQKITEDGSGSEYFRVLETTFQGLNDLELSYELVEMWYAMQLLKITGHGPNLQRTKGGMQLEPQKLYDFDIEAMYFTEQENGQFNQNHIKLLRLVYASDTPKILKHITKVDEIASATQRLSLDILKQHLTV